MIDVSSLPTAAHAAIALLIERSGAEGRRLKELIDESPLARQSVSRILADLHKSGYCFKIDGDAPRYYSPSASPVIPSALPVRQPASPVRPSALPVRQPASPVIPSASPVGQQASPVIPTRYRAGFSPKSPTCSHVGEFRGFVADSGKYSGIKTGYVL